MVCSVDVRFSIAVRVVPAVSVHKVALQDNSPAAAVPCTQRALSPAEALREQLAPVLASSALVSAARVPASAVRAPEWVRPDSFRLRAKRRVRSAQAAHSAAVVSSTKRVKKAR